MHAASRYTSERNLLWLKREMQECFQSSRGHHSSPGRSFVATYIGQQRVRTNCMHVLRLLKRGSVAERVFTTELTYFVICCSCGS